MGHFFVGLRILLKQKSLQTERYYLHVFFPFESKRKFSDEIELFVNIHNKCKFQSTKSLWGILFD